MRAGPRLSETRHFGHLEGSSRLYPLPHVGQCAEVIPATSPGVRSSVTRQMSSESKPRVKVAVCADLELPRVGSEEGRSLVAAVQARSAKTEAPPLRPHVPTHAVDSRRKAATRVGRWPGR